MVGDTGGALDTRRIRRLKSPQILEVRADANGLPVNLHLRGVWQDVTIARSRWRIDQHWWREEHIQRDYFSVTTRDGQFLTIYFDIQNKIWSQQNY